MIQILFGEVSVKEEDIIKSTLNQYEKVLGQKINLEKSKIFFLNTNLYWQRRITNILGISYNKLSMKNLEGPLLVGDYRTTFLGGSYQ